MILVYDVSHWTDRTLLILFDHKQVTFPLESLSLSSSSSVVVSKKKHTDEDYKSTDRLLYATDTS